MQLLMPTDGQMPLDFLPNPLTNQPPFILCSLYQDSGELRLGHKEKACSLSNRTPGQMR